MDDATFWAITYAGIVSWQYHPGNRRDKAAISLKECAAVADAALVEYKARFPNGYDTD